MTESEMIETSEISGLSILCSSSVDTYSQLKHLSKRNFAVKSAPLSQLQSLNFIHHRNLYTYGHSVCAANLWDSSLVRNYRVSTFSPPSPYQKEENARRAQRGEPPLPISEEAIGHELQLKPVVAPPRLESLLVGQQVDLRCQQITELAGKGVASSPGSPRVSHLRAWYIFSHYLIARGQDRSKDGCTSLPFAGDIVSALGLWYKWAPKSSYKKYRFAAFLRCLRTAAVLTHAKIHLSNIFLPYASR